MRARRVAVSMKSAAKAMRVAPVRFVRMEHAKGVARLGSFVATGIHAVRQERLAVKGNAKRVAATISRVVQWAHATTVVAVMWTRALRLELLVFGQMVRFAPMDRAADVVAPVSLVASRLTIAHRRDLIAMVALAKTVVALGKHVAAAAAAIVVALAAMGRALRVAAQTSHVARARRVPTERSVRTAGAFRVVVWDSRAAVTDPAMGPAWFVGVTPAILVGETVSGVALSTRVTMVAVVM